MLGVKNISTAYGMIQVLHDVTLRVEERQIISVIGSNGAGKTTLLHSIIGLCRVAHGNITFLDRQINKLPSYEIVRLGISLVPEGRLVFGPMTVYDNLLMGAYPLFCRKGKEKMSESLELVYSLFPILKVRAKQLGATLSGGEQQMVSIGRAIMSDPKMLLLDEPSLGLAPLVLKEIYEKIMDLNYQNKTILLVEQNAKIALNICDNAYVLENGKIILEEKGEALLSDARIKKAYLGE